MTSTENMTNTENPLPIPPSRLADAFGGVLDVAHRVTRPVFVDVEHVPAEGPFMLVGNHQLLGMDSRVALPARAVVRRVAGRDDVGTLFVLGSGPLGLSGTGRLYFHFGRPIATTRWSGRAEDPAALTECRDVVQASVERSI